MKRNCFTISSICLLAVMLFTACTQQFPGYKKTESGLYYKFYSHNTTAPKPNQTDVMKVAMTCYLHDSVYFDFQKTESEVYAQLKESVFPADLNEAYTMMHRGDSASFYIKADSVAIKYDDKNPEEVGLKPDDYFRYEVKMLEIQLAHYEEYFDGDECTPSKEYLETRLEEVKRKLERWFDF